MKENGRVAANQAANRAVINHLEPVDEIALANRLDRIFGRLRGDRDVHVAHDFEPPANAAGYFRIDDRLDLRELLTKAFCDLERDRQEELRRRRAGEPDAVEDLLLRLLAEAFERGDLSRPARNRSMGEARPTD